MENSPEKEGIAKASVSLDNSDIGSSINNTTFEYASHSSSNRLQLSLTPEANKNYTFMTLPVEMRLEIYDLLLVSRIKSNLLFFRLPVGRRSKKIIFIDYHQDPNQRTMEPAILQTCKQVYHEAVPILYTRNVFGISRPENAMHYMTQIGPDNTKLIRTLHAYVSWWADALPWVALLNTQAKDAAGLRFVELSWGSESELPFRGNMLHNIRGLGDNVLFARALASFKQLEKLRVRGFYAKNWPSYFEKELGIQVHAECGFPEPNNNNTARIHKQNEITLPWFKLYQEGTEDLFP